MDIALPGRLRAHLLMAGEARLDLSALQAALNARLAAAEVVFAPGASPDGLLLTAGRLHLAIGASPEPLPRETLRDALASDYGAWLGEDWPALVARHEGALILTLGAGPAPDAAPPVPAGGPSAELFERMLTALQVAAAHLAAAAPVAALHWAPSAQLVPPGRLAALDDLVFPLPLFLHPRPLRGPAGTGADLLGAPLLIGRPLRMTPAPVPRRWIVTRLLAFAAHARALGAPPATGESFGLADGERIAIADAPDGTLLLTPRRVAGQDLAAA